MANEWDEFELIGDSRSPRLDKSFDTHLTGLDSLFGGQLRQSVLNQASWDEFELIPEPAPAIDRAPRIRDVRQQLLEEDREVGRNQDLEQLDLGDRALLGFGQGLEGLRRSGAGLLEATGFRETGANLAKESARESRVLSDLESTDQSLAGDFVAFLSSLATSSSPIIPATILGGLNASAITGGLQSFGSTFEDAKDAYKQQGLSEDEAYRKAFIPATISGAITGLVTKGFGNTGIEAMRKGITQGGISSIVRAVMTQGGLEAAEESVDQIGQEILAHLSYDPNRSIADSVKNVFVSGFGGWLLGSGVTAGREAIGRIPQAAEGIRDALTPAPVPTPPAPIMGSTLRPRVNLPVLTPAATQNQIPLPPASFPGRPPVTPVTPVPTIDPIDQAELEAQNAINQIAQQQSSQPQYPGDAVQLQTDGQVGQLPAQINAPGTTAGSGDSVQIAAQTTPEVAKPVQEVIIPSQEFSVPPVLEPKTAGQPASSPILPPVVPAPAIKPLEIEVFRGSGRAKKGNIYSAGIDSPIFGDGGYYAFDEATARKFGPKVELHKVALKNPLMIRTAEDYQRLVKESGIKYSKFWQTAPNKIQSAVTDAGKKFQQYLRANGYDGVIVRGVAADPLLEEAFAEDQIFVLSSVGAGSARQGQIAPNVDPPTWSIPDPVGTAQGVDGIRQLFNSAKNLPANVVAVANAFLDTPVMRDLDWSKLRVELHENLGSGLTGLALGKLIQLSTSARADTLPHEVFHLLYDMLPSDYAAAIESERVNQINKLKIDPALKKRLIAGMTTDEFVQLMNVVTKEGFFESGTTPTVDVIQSVYDTINPSEFLAAFAGNKFSKAAFDNRNSGTLKKLAQRIKEWIQGLIDGLKRIGNVTPDMERVYRELLAGKHKTSPQTGAEYERQGSFSPTAKAAATAVQVSQTPEQLDTQAIHQSVQGNDITDFLNTHGANRPGIAASIQKALRYFEYSGIADVGQRAMGGVKEGYRQIKARLQSTLSPEMFEQKKLEIARLLAQQMSKFDTVLAEAIKNGKEAARLMAAPAFLRLKAKEYQTRINKINADAVRLASRNALDVALKQAHKAIRDGDKNDLEIARLQSQINELEAAMGSSAAMHQLLDDMVNVLSASPPGRAALGQLNLHPAYYGTKWGTRTGIIALYTALKKGAGQPVHNPNLIKWAAYLIERNRKLRDQLFAAYYLKQPQVFAQLNPFQQKLAADLKSDPVNTILRLLQNREKQVTDYDKARFVWMQTNREFIQRETELNDLMEAGIIAERILNDPNYHTLRKEVRDDGKYIGNQKPLFIATGKDGDSITLPSGKLVNIDLSQVKGDKTLFEQTYRPEIKQAIDELDAWLNDTANFDHPNYGSYKIDRERLDQFYYGLDLLRPNDSSGMFAAAFHTIDGALREASGYVAGLAKKTASRWGRIKMKAGWWSQRWSDTLSTARRKALENRNLPLGSDIIDSNRRWYYSVQNELAKSHSRPEGGFKVGDVLSSGETVTQADLDELRTQADAIAAGFDVLKEEGELQISADFLGDTKEWREAHKTNDLMVTRKFNEDLAAFGKEFSLARDEYDVVFKASNQAGMTAAQDKMADVLNRFWMVEEGIGRALVSDRDADFAQATSFDGPNGIFQQLTQAGLSSIRSFDELVDAIHQLTGQPHTDIRTELLSEFGRIIQNWYDNGNETDAPMGAIKADEAKNALTRARGKALAPFAFYRYGFEDTTRAVGRFAATIHSRAMDSLVGALTKVKEDYDRQITDLARKTDALAAQGVRFPRMTAIQQQALLRNSGQSYDNYKGIQRRRAMIINAINDLAGREIFDAEQDQTAGRTIGLLTGLLVSGIPTTARNVTSGPKYLGAAAKRLTGSYAFAYPHAVWQIWLKGAFRMLQSGVQTAWSLAPDLIKNLKQVRQNPQGWATGAFQTFIHAAGENIFTNMKEFAALEREGKLYRHDWEQNALNRMLGTVLYGGKVLHREYSLGEKLLSWPAAVMELLSLPLRILNPGLGDAVTNVGAAGVALSAVDKMEQKLNRLYEDWKKSGYRQFDFNETANPINLISADEIFYKSKDPSGDLLRAREMYDRSGIDFNRAIIEYFKEQEAWNASGKTGPQPKFLTEEQRGKIQGVTINFTNRPSPTGSPLNLIPNNFIKSVLVPFLPWKVRTFNEWLGMLRVPAVGKAANTINQLRKQKAIQWTVLMTLVLLPFLLFAGLIGSPFEEEVDRAIKKVLYNQVKATRQPWEREGIASQLRGWGLSATLGVPFLDMVVNTAINDLPNRASVDPSIAVIEKAKDTVKFIGGVMQTGDITYKLPEYVGSILPDTKAILNRLDSQEGTREANNVTAGLRRFAEVDLMRPMGSDTGVNVTPLTPYSQIIENAVYSGDQSLVKEKFDEAVAKATELGIENPEERVKQSMMARNPYNRVFNVKLTPDQRKALLERMPEDIRLQTEQAELLWQQAAETVGANITFEKKERASGGTSLPTYRTASFSRPRASSGSRRGGVASLSTRARRVRTTTRRRPRVSRLRLPSRTARRRVRR